MTLVAYISAYLLVRERGEILMVYGVGPEPAVSTRKSAVRVMGYGYFDTVRFELNGEYVLRPAWVGAQGVMANLFLPCEIVERVLRGENNASEPISFSGRSGAWGIEVNSSFGSGDSDGMPTDGDAERG